MADDRPPPERDDEQAPGAEAGEAPAGEAPAAAPAPDEAPAAAAPAPDAAPAAAPDQRMNVPTPADLAAFIATEKASASDLIRKERVAKAGVAGARDPGARDPGALDPPDGAGAPPPTRQSAPRLKQSAPSERPSLTEAPAATHARLDESSEGLASVGDIPPEALEQGTSLWRDAWRRLLRNRAAVGGAILVALMMLASLCAPLIASTITHFDFDEQHLTGQAKPPGARSVPWRHVTYYDADVMGFAAVDVDRDGEVTAEELNQALARVEFARFDEDGDGALSDEEIEAAPINLIDLDEGVSAAALTRWGAYIVAFEGLFDRFDADRDHDLRALEVATAREALQGVETAREQLFVRLLAAAQGAGLPLARRAVREHGRALLAEACAEGARCPIGFEDSRLYTDIFPMAQARAFVADHDDDGDGALSAAELPGVPEPRVHLLGSDDQGRDLLTRILYGGRISFAVGLLATLVSFLIGVSWGAVAGYAGGRVDNVMMRVVDVLYGLPFMFLVILLMVIFGREIYLLFIALGAVQWLTMSRIVRGQIISLKRREFVEAARSIGVSPRRIVFKHLIPNALGPIIVYATLTVPAVMLEEAFLSFLGLGVQAPMASFGTLVNAGAEDMISYPWLIIYPGGALALTLLSLNFLGDGLRDALDPQARKD